MGGQVSVDESVHVVIVGGGFGGIAAAQHLKHYGVPFMLIDVLDAFHHNVAALRASVQTGFARKTFIPYKETFGLNFLQGRVIRIDTETQTVVLDNGKEVRYSHLILCTGTTGSFPSKHNSVDTYKSAIQKYEDFFHVIKEANAIVVVGGGTTGVEMAAEIKTEFHDKKVVLIHPREEVADPELLPCVKEQAKQVLLEKGVELLLGQKVSNLEELELNVCRSGMVVKTNKNEQVTTDLVICCTGSKINSEAYRSSMSSCLAENGALKVNKHLQVEGFDNVYAVGDCANLSEPKMAYHAGLHAGVAATNIINSLSGKALTSYKTGNVTMLIAMGKDAGVGQFNGYKLPRFLVTKGKSEGLLLWKSWREMGQKAPN
ncbi:ferroptosis suppressor protein 1 isoform X1 [Danio rerio]|uniref:Ferroptosis suppressor protein 1 n=1 Tax=Danio rerio TaxID=7955 RepID=E7FFC4_DANRE|nr:apoptosis-inducing factor 2 [Danio rerio]XP_005156584.1 apoptosis-inducing factor 2 isoform X1 [Danio rerio]|eukprot:NP_001186939.1 apoptosis-inducing factor 2 [Danio rerio]